MQQSEMHIDQIINLIEHALVSAAGSFETAANGLVEGVNWCADRMPESWIVSVLMRAAQEQGLAAFPEVRIKQDVEYFESGGQILRPEYFPNLLKGTAKIDLFLGDQSLLSGRMRLRVALELKGPKSNWQHFHADLERLREIKKKVNGEDQAVIFAYLTCPLLDGDQQKNEERKLEISTDLELKDFTVLRSLRNNIGTDGRKCVFVYMHILP